MADIVPYLAPSATLIVGLSVGFIAWQQWQLARSKLRLDLFDRRYKVFDATRKFLAVIVKDSRFEDSQLFEFYAGTSDAEFLFGSEVVDYVTEIRKRALDMRTHQKVYDRVPVGEERSRHVQAEHDQLVWLGDQLTTMSKTFRPYLGFSHVKRANDERRLSLGASRSCRPRECSLNGHRRVLPSCPSGLRCIFKMHRIYRAARPEPCEAKVSRTVLRGCGRVNRLRLPGVS